MPIMRNPLLIPDLRELIQAGETGAVREFLDDLHPAQVAEMVEDLGEGEGDAVFELMEPRGRAEVLSYLRDDEQVRIVDKMSPGAAASLLHHMSHDERADLFKHLDEERVDLILPHLAQAEREDIRRLASYEPGTAGAVMTTDYATLPPHLTVRESLEKLRHESPDRETIYYIYVVDAERTLIGFVSLKSLILARPLARIESIMKREPLLARVDEDQESVARKIDKYDLIAIPVVDAAGMLLGIVTHDDAMDILRQEQTEDILKFGGVSTDHEIDDIPYWQGTVWRAVSRRLKWLVILFMTESLTGWVLRHYAWVDERELRLHLWVPLLIGTGGNAGSQTVGTVIRGVALGEIRFRDTFAVLAREVATGFLLGLVLGAVGFLWAFVLRGENVVFACVIALTILGICMWANGVSALVPLAAQRFGQDPAVISAPFISTLVDATGLVIFYTIAIFLLNIVR